MIKDEDRDNLEDGQQSGVNADYTSSDDSFSEPDRRREPSFGDFDDDEFEEPERDTDYSSGYFDDDPADYEPQATNDPDALDQYSPQGSSPPEQTTLLEGEQDTATWDDEQPTHATRDDVQEEETPDPWGGPLEEPSTQAGSESFSAAGSHNEYTQDSGGWPLGLIAVAVLAVILLAAGGYGVTQQRAATQEEIRQLRSQLASTAAPALQNESHRALEEARQRTVELNVELESLRLENRRLNDTVAGLEAQLEAQQEALEKPVASPKPSTPKPKPAPAPTPAPAAPPETPSDSNTASAAAATLPTAPAESGGWFVNFGSYSQQTTAQKWSETLKPESGRSTVTSAQKDGKTYYRVRIVGLEDRASAERVARKLEAEYGLPKLWVGK